MTSWNEFSPEKSDGIGVIKYVVCAYCLNRMRQRCIEECAPEGLYRNLEPKELDVWQPLPQLPSMARSMEYAPVTRFTLLYLIVHYMMQDLGKPTTILHYMSSPEE